MLTIVSAKYRANWRDEMVVLVPGLVIFAFVSSQTGFSIHFRYVLPAFPFFFVWMSKVGRVFESGPADEARGGRFRLARTTFRDPQTYLRAFVAGCLLWTVGSTLWHAPHWLSYFNELAGGPLNGPKHLLDSNIDWGQDLLFLKKWQDNHPESQPLRAALYCSYDPAILGLKLGEAPPSVERLRAERQAARAAGGAGGPENPPSGGGELGSPSSALTPGWYALSVNMLYDRYGTYAYFRELKPDDYAGYSIYLYHLSEDDCRCAREFRPAEAAAGER